MFYVKKKKKKEKKTRLDEAERWPRVLRARFPRGEINGAKIRVRQRWRWKEAVKRRIYRRFVGNTRAFECTAGGDFEKRNRKKEGGEKTRSLVERPGPARREPRETVSAPGPSVIVSRKHGRSVCSYLEKSARGRRRRRAERRRNPLSLSLPFSENSFSYF